MKHEKDDSLKIYSPFCGLVFVFLVLLTLQVFTLKQNLARRNALEETRQRIELAMPNAVSINTTIENLSRDLIDLSAKSDEAKKIVTEHNIKFNRPTTPVGK